MLERQLNTQRPGNKRFRCPACNEFTRVSILIGYQVYICPNTKKEILIEAQQLAFKSKGKTVNLKEYFNKD